MFIRLREMTRRTRSRSSKRRSKRRTTRKSNKRRATSRKQRGGMLEIAEDYPEALITTLSEEKVPQTQSVKSFYEESDANPDASA